MESQNSAAIALIQRLNSLVAELSSDDLSQARETALGLSRQLVITLQQPESASVELMFGRVIPVAARIAIHLNLFKHISDSTSPLNSRALAELSGAEELLIVRVLRPMAAMGFVKEVGERTWRATPITSAMATEGIAAGHRFLGDMIIAAANKATSYFKKYGPQCPTDPRDDLMQYAFQTKLTTFELLQSMPEVFKDFNMFMGNTVGNRGYWIDWFPIQELLLDEATSQSVLLVDVGGGRGHDLVGFREKYPGQGRLILQDLPAVIDSISGLDPAIETMAYDFFTDQPVEGARAYFYHHIFHDWSDVKCLEILKGLKKAMKPGYSKLLIHDMIIPEQGASLFHSMLDMNMMVFNSGMERTEKQWGELISMAGLKVARFWTPPKKDADGIIEVILEP
ncbi:putative O-methyltransferase [Nemania sp. FL0916]|nr:putative O-methyltransferase [Nemania sp. FL0916]